MTIVRVNGVPYYIRDHALERAADYYGAHEALLQVAGQGAAMLGLGTHITAEEFHNLARRMAPDGRHELLQQQTYRDGRQPAAFVDIQVSVPKTISVEVLLLPQKQREEALAALGSAVKELIAAVDQCACTRRGKGGRIIEPANIIAVPCLHLVSRAGEPQVHLHICVFTVCVRNDHTTAALLTPPIFKDVRKYDEIFNEAAARHLREIGFDVRVRQGQLELIDPPDALVQLADRFSSRRRQILAEVGGRVERGKAAAEERREAALRTRPRKTETPAAVLFENWNRIGREMGFSRREALQLLHEHRMRRVRPLEQALRDHRQAVEMLGRTDHSNKETEQPPASQRVWRPDRRHLKDHHHRDIRLSNDQVFVPGAGVVLEVGDRVWFSTYSPRYGIQRNDRGTITDITKYDPFQRLAARRVQDVSEALRPKNPLREFIAWRNRNAWYSIPRLHNPLSDLVTFVRDNNIVTRLKRVLGTTMVTIELDRLKTVTIDLHDYPYIHPETLLPEMFQRNRSADSSPLTAHERARTDLYERTH